MTTTVNYRPLSLDDRRMLTHSSMYGGAECFVDKLQRTGKWSWSFLSNKAPVVYARKRDALESCEKYLEVLRALSGMESQARAVCSIFVYCQGDRERVLETISAQAGVDRDRAASILAEVLERTAGGTFAADGEWIPPSAM